MTANVSATKFKLFPIGRRKSEIDEKRHTIVGRRLSVNRRLTQAAFGIGSTGIISNLAGPSEPVRVNVITYDEGSYNEGTYKKVEEIPHISTTPETLMTWIDVDGTHHSDIVTQLGNRYDIHSLVQADIQTQDQRTKLDVFEDALFLVCKLMYHDTRSAEDISVQQICFYLKHNILITFRQQSTDLFDSIKNRIRLGKGRIRKSKIDYLFYSLVDVIVDQYMDVLDAMGTKLENIDNQLIKSAKRDTLEHIYEMKHRLFYIRSITSPLKEIIIKLQKEEETQIMQESTNIYLKDLFDHIVQVNDSVDAYREMLASFIDFYMMLNSNRMNEVVKTLTIISTIFIPLTFISGVYGMNFENMPELKYKYGYYIVLAVMGVLAFFMLSIFKRKHWF